MPERVCWTCWNLRARAGVPAIDFFCHRHGPLPVDRRCADWADWIGDSIQPKVQRVPDTFAKGVLDG